MSETIILGIESSCDDTSAAIIKGNQILSNIAANQTIHNEYGGALSNKCYVITDDYNIYKCITNNEDSPSLYKPSGAIFDVATKVIPRWNNF